MIKRLRPEDIKAGRTYKLVGRYNPYSVTRRVEDIRGDKVLVLVNDELKEFSLKKFADLAVMEMEGNCDEMG